MQKLHLPILRTIKREHLTPKKPNFTAFSGNASSLENLSTSNEVLAFINSGYPIEPGLRKLSPFLNREVVISVLQSQAQLQNDPRICFRFFIWVAKRPQFRSGVSSNLIVDMLLSGENGSSFDLYWSVLDELRNEKARFSADAFLVLILSYWRLRKAEKAVETFGRMKDYECKPNLAACNVVLNVLVKKEVILLALAVYNMMLKSNLRMGCDTFNVLIDGLCKNGMTQDALKLYDEMTMRGILPNRITYTIVISGLCKANRTHEAYKLFNSIRDHCRLDSATYTALIDGFCKHGQIDEAVMLFKSSQAADEYNFQMEGYSCLIDGLMKAKRISEAEELFQKVLDVGLEPDLLLYTTVIHGLSKAGRMQDAVNMLRVMIGKGILPDTRCYNVLIKGFCDIGLLDQARSLKVEISKHNKFPNTYTHTILICGLCRNGLLSEAQQIFNDMEKLGCSPSAVTFNALIDGLCKAGKLEEAHLMLYKMELGKNPSLFLRLSQGADRVLDSASLQKMVENLVESGLILKAYKLLTQLADSGVVPNVKTYNTLIHGMCKAGQVNGALKLFEEIQLKGHLPDSVTYSTLIDGLYRVGRDNDAHKVFEQMKENGCKPSTCVYKTLMTWACRRRKLSVAFGFWLKYLEIHVGKEDGALKSSEQYFEKGDLEKAVRNILEMDIKLADYDSSPYSIWLIGLCQANRVDDAVKIFYILEEYNVVVSAPGCVKLIDALCIEGELDKAVDIFLSTMENGYQLMPRVCNDLLRALLYSMDKAVLAFELVKRMESMGYDLKSYLNYSTKALLSGDYPMRKTENVSAGKVSGLAYSFPVRRDDV